MRHPAIIEHIIILDMLKRSLTGVARILHRQQVLAEQRKAFSVG
jgi:hypothetical protein